MSEIQRPITEVISVDARTRLINGANVLCNAVKSTLGASGRTVIIEDRYGNPHATKDGVTVAKSIYLDESVENMGAQVVRQAAIRTAEEAGDGTTTSVTLAQHLINSELVGPELPFSELRAGMQAAVDNVIKYLTDNSARTLKKDVVNVATVSTNNDAELGGIIAEAFHRAGKNGMVVMDESPTESTYVEMVDGVQLGRGYSSPLFVNDPKRNKAIYNHPVVFISDIKIDLMSQIDFPSAVAVDRKKPLFIIAECSEEVLNTLAYNKIKGLIQVVVIPPPDFGYRRKDTMNDLGALCGCHVMSDDTGDNFQNVGHGHLGTLESVIVSKNSSILMPSAEVDFKNHLELLQSQRKESKSKPDQDWLKERIANLSSSVALVKVGGKTEVERKEKKDRVDDAIHAVEAALEEGIVPGGGVALARAFMSIPKRLTDNLAFDVGYQIVWDSLTVPMTTILRNANKEISDAFLKDPDFFVGYDIDTGAFINMRDAGIVDPLKVVKSALSNAVSAAYNILSTENVITYARSSTVS